MLFNYFLPFFFPGTGFLAWTRTFRFRVRANSPNLWPTLSSVILQRKWVFPLYILNVQPTNSGKIVDLRDQIFLFISRSLLFFILNRNASTKQSFHIVRCDGNPDTQSNYRFSHNWCIVFHVWLSKLNWFRIRTSNK